VTLWKIKGNREKTAKQDGRTNENFGTKKILIRRLGKAGGKPTGEHNKLIAQGGQKKKRKEGKVRNQGRRAARHPQEFDLCQRTVT